MDINEKQIKYLTQSYKLLEIDKEYYFTIKEFSQVIKKSKSTVRALIDRGSKVRKLKIMKVENKVFIPLSELFEFPFVVRGNFSNKAVIIEKFYFNANCKLISKEVKYKG